MSKISGFWKGLKIQIAGFLKVFKFQLNVTAKYYLEKSTYFANNQIFKKKIKFKNIKEFWKSSPHLLSNPNVLPLFAMLYVLNFSISKNNWRMG